MAIHMRMPAGITGCTDEAPAPEYYRFNSRWDGIVRGQQVTVFAGSLRGDPTRGVLLVKASPMDATRPGGRQFEGPAGSGTLRLVGWAGERLKLMAENGDAVWFEIPIASKSKAA